MGGNAPGQDATGKVFRLRCMADSARHFLDSVEGLARQGRAPEVRCWLK